jgi:hypothetical protein
MRHVRIGTDKVHRQWFTITEKYERTKRTERFQIQRTTFDKQRQLDATGIRIRN